MPTINNQLAVGLLSSLVQRPGADLKDARPRMVIAQSQAAERLQGRGLAPGSRMISHRLPGDVPRIVANAPAGTASTIRCVETGKELPRVPKEWAPAIDAYYHCCQVAFDPAGFPRNADAGHATRPKDAFTQTVALLPPAIMESSLLNRGLKGAAGAGKVVNDVPNTLFDPATGLAASISVRNGNEVVIAFGGCGSQEGTLAQAVRCAINLLGIAPPASFPQAARLTTLVRDHLAELNKTRPPADQLKLTLAGHSMGGGMATYASLRCGVPAMVMAPMRLGYMARQSLGAAALANAPSLVTEVSCARDWVAANPLSRLMHWMGMKNSVGAIGSRYLIDIPSRAALAGIQAASFSSHVDFDIALKIQVKQEEKSNREAAKLEGLRQLEEDMDRLVNPTKTRTSAASQTATKHDPPLS